MIGMMYLVLTALLALNVSREVLQAFNNITRGIDETVLATEQSIDARVLAFQNQVGRMNGDSLATAYWNKVQTTVTLSDSLDKEIERIKKLLVEAEESQSYDDGPESYLGSNMLVLVEEENVDIASRFLADPNQERNAYGKRLKELINYTRQKYVGILSDLNEMNEEKLVNIEKSFTLSANDDEANPDPAKRKWEFTTFNNVPLGAALAVLTKTQNDLRNTESQVIDEITAGMSEGKPPVDGLLAMVKPNATSIPIGGSYEADIFLGARMGSISPEITVDGEPIEVLGSTGRIKIPVSGEGSVTKPVTIKYLNAKKGTTEVYETELSYEGFRTPAIVSPTKMNVVYLGLQNPVSVSVPGFEPQNVMASLTPAGCGTLTRSGTGEYIAHITNRTTQKCSVNVSVRMSDGSVRSMGATEFRIKKVPKPYASVNAKGGGAMSIAEIGAARRIDVSLGPDFVFGGIKYRVTKYDYLYKPDRKSPVKGDATGPQFTAELKESCKNAKRGDLLIISQIYASTPGVGEVLLPASLVFTVK